MTAKTHIYYTFKAINTWQWAQALLLQQQIAGEQLIKRHGKPIILDNPWGVSWSHSHHLSVMVIAKGAIGIDAEYQRALDWQRLSRRFLPSWRQAQIHSREDFFLHWTQLEAQSKKHGLSLFKGRHLPAEATQSFIWQNYCISLSGLQQPYQLTPWVDHCENAKWPQAE